MGKALGGAISVRSWYNDQHLVCLCEKDVQLELHRLLVAVALLNVTTALLTVTAALLTVTTALLTLRETNIGPHQGHLHIHHVVSCSEL